jgi:hypothetical protein
MLPAQFDQEYGCVPLSGISNVFPSLTELMTSSLEETNPTHFYSILASKQDYTAVSIIDRNTHSLVYQEQWQGDWEPMSLTYSIVSNSSMGSTSRSCFKRRFDPRAATIALDGIS